MSYFPSVERFRWLSKTLPVWKRIAIVAASWGLAISWWMIVLSVLLPFGLGRWLWTGEWRKKASA